MDSETRKYQVPRSATGIIRHQAHRYGRSVNGTSLEFYGPRSGPVDILLFASIHGDETDTTVVLSHALREVGMGGLRNPVVLCANPDGAVNGTRCNARGVDLNRNYEWGWGNQCQGSSGTTTGETYRGPYEGSEPEAQAMIGLGRRIRGRESAHQYGAGAPAQPGGPAGQRRQPGAQRIAAAFSK